MEKEESIKSHWLSNVYICMDANTISKAHNASTDDEVFNYESSNENKVNVCVCLA